MEFFMYLLMFLFVLNHNRYFLVSVSSKRGPQVQVVMSWCRNDVTLHINKRCEFHHVSGI